MSKKTKHIAIYGKGGIGKSTTTSNISAALAESGYKVIQIGCDPKSDSTNTLRGGNYLPTVLDSLRESNNVKLKDISEEGFGGVLCIEAGGPVPGVGCAGRGINAAVSVLQELDLFEKYKADYVLYDVLGDVVCGGFAVPIRDGITDRAYVVTSSDFMAIYAANNLFKAINKYAPTGGAKLGGIIGNGLSANYSKSIVDDFAKKTGTKVAGYVPRSLIVSQSELYGKTVIEANPKSEHANIYRNLAKFIAEDEDLSVPNPLSVNELRDWAREWGDKIYKFDSRIVEGPASI
ncbi:AAA family ATPase [Clostridium tyrobutyricum]|jgi:nitrogenase iron protein NifH|uniref:Nitrogenase iron protein n=1 Tax=Clostridium tyrobutyricum DIVETGP TaxID=1408889 RepID=W6N2X8_CLOTY|nr:nitrogenase iron protein NifH [Clostridium tyrobutyricum]AND84863.1 nitrogenase II [Clostridium tyrobutyricum]ANP69442.1 nitrogenase iron protein [Clostridium tyrobutyricum]MBR9647742.1 AAA family ATPase [Clostridium tyrobutyricum]MBV4420456.1 AAA family ATPase [Clostridium tyrobutyricum]MBV4428063.1 AAA family ATPase [Clostridium tyrobutyricum]